MFYCERCATSSGLAKPFFKSYRDCDLCGEFTVVYDTGGYQIDDDAPCMKDPIVIPGTRPKNNRRCHGIFKWQPVRGQRGRPVGRRNKARKKQLEIVNIIS